MKLISRQKNSIIQISEINLLARYPEFFISECEKGYQHQINEVVDLILESQGRYRVVLLAGPSSSGKTTTAHKISEEFGRRGVSAPGRFARRFLPRDGVLSQASRREPRHGSG